MPRPDRSVERRTELVPLLAEVFAELGYRRTTTAELAARCGVQETTLYRLWPDKRAMFIAAVEHVFAASEVAWRAIEEGDDASAAERLLEHEATHHGERGLYRILFAGLSEADDPEIAAALKRVYRSFQRYARGRVEEHRGTSEGEPDAELAAWALLGLGTIANVGRELGLLSGPLRARLFREAGRILVDGDGR